MHLMVAFPQIVDADCHQTSPQDRLYNCIGYAAGRRQFWWPIPGPPLTFWPITAPRVLTVAAFVTAFASVGYQPCDNEGLEDGIEKIALFVDGNGIPTHAAKQLPDGMWSSKLGKLEDITHPLRQVEGPPPSYGIVACFMSRPRKP